MASGTMLVMMEMQQMSPATEPWWLVLLRVKLMKGKEWQVFVQALAFFP